MQFLNPIWLWGLTALMVPITIHMLSRREGKIIRIGSIRHLEETNSKQFKSIRLNEVALLLLRCSLILLIVFLLSGFRLQVLEHSQKWLLIEPGLEHDNQFSTFIDSLGRNGFEVRFLSEGFPPVSDSISYDGKINYWKVLEHVKKSPLNQAVVLSYNYADGFRGKRTSLPQNVRWISKNPAPGEFGLSAIRLSGDSVQVRVGKSNSERTTFTTMPAKIPAGKDFFKLSASDSISIEASREISIQVVRDPNFVHDTKMIVAALQAIDDFTSVKFDINTFSPEQFSLTPETEWVIWLSNEKRSLSNVSSICYEEKIGSRLFEKKGPNSWILTRRLNEQIALDQNLPVLLGQILEQQKNYDRKATAKDRRVLEDEVVWATTPINSAERPAALATSTEKFLMTIFLFVLLFERWMANKKNQ